MKRRKEKGIKRAVHPKAKDLPTCESSMLWLKTIKSVRKLQKKEAKKKARRLLPLAKKLDLIVLTDLVTRLTGLDTARQTLR